MALDRRYSTCRLLPLPAGRTEAEPAPALAARCAAAAASALVCRPPPSTLMLAGRAPLSLVRRNSPRASDRVRPVPLRSQRRGSLSVS